MCLLLACSVVSCDRPSKGTSQPAALDDDSGGSGGEGGSGGSGGEGDECCAEEVTTTLSTSSSSCDMPTTGQAIQPVATVMGTNECCQEPVFPNTRRPLDTTKSFPVCPPGDPCINENDRISYLDMLCAAQYGRGWFLQYDGCDVSLPGPTVNTLLCKRLCRTR